MNIGAIRSLGSAFQNQSVSNTQRVDRDGDNDGSGVSGVGGRHHHGGGGAFMQDIG